MCSSHCGVTRCTLCPVVFQLCKVTRGGAQEQQTQCGVVCMCVCVCVCVCVVWCPTSTRNIQARECRSMLLTTRPHVVTSDVKPAGDCKLLEPNKTPESRFASVCQLHNVPVHVTRGGVGGGGGGLQSSVQQVRRPCERGDSKHSAIERWYPCSASSETKAT
jgi:hypothetical protein